MHVSHAGLILLGIATVLAKPPTAAQLQARVTQLEAENADLARNYDRLLASCRSHAEPDAQSGAPRTRNVDDDLFWLGEFDYGVTETTNAFLRFGWKVTVHNKLGRNEVFDLTVQFLNKDNLVIESGHLGVQTSRAFDEQEVTGDVVIRLPSALNVASAKAIINRHR